MRRLHAQRSEAYTVAELCGLFGKSKQAYYKHDSDIDRGAWLWKSSPYNTYVKSRPKTPHRRHEGLGDVLPHVL